MQELYHQYMTNRQERTAIITTATFSLNGLMGIGQLLLGIFLFSPWHIANSIYYLLLSAAKGRMLKKYKLVKSIEDEQERYAEEFAIYKSGGIFIILLGASYLCVCLWMYFTGESRVQSELWLVLAVATIAFVKIGFAVHGMIAYRHMHNPLMSLIKTINLLSAMVSIVVTQCTLLSMNQIEAAVSSSSLFGMCVSAVFMVIGILMILRKEKPLANKVAHADPVLLSAQEPTKVL